MLTTIKIMPHLETTVVNSACICIFKLLLPNEQHVCDKGCNCKSVQMAVLLVMSNLVVPPDKTLILGVTVILETTVCQAVCLVKYDISK